jgi:hypothetical protein
MFPDSKIAQGYSQGSTRMAYVLNYGLGSLFNEHLRAVKSSICFTGYFDESTNRVIKQGKMDLHVRFFYPITRLITTRYFISVFF